MKVRLLRAQTKHTEFIYNLYCHEVVLRGHGLHRPIPGPHWRSIIQGIFDGWQHVYVIHNGVIPVGHVGFQSHSKEDRRAELVISITPDLHRRGIATTALDQALEHAFTSFKAGGLGLDVVWVGVISDNEPSIKLFNKAGFLYYGEIPHYFRFGAKTFSRRIYAARAVDFVN